MTEKQASPGWYPDPAGNTEKLRYWDGAQWTDEVRNKDDFAPLSPAPREQLEHIGADGFWTGPYPSSDTSKFAIFSLVSGLLGLAFLWLMLLFGYLGGILAIVFGAKGLTSNRRKMSIAGIALGIAVIVISLILHILSVVLLFKTGQYF